MCRDGYRKRIGRSVGLRTSNIGITGLGDIHQLPRTELEKLPRDGAAEFCGVLRGAHGPRANDVGTVDGCGAAPDGQFVEDAAVVVE